MQRWSIRSQIIALLLVTAVPLAGAGVFSVVRDYRNSAQRAEFASVDLAVATANAIAQSLDDGDSVLSRLAEDADVRALDRARCRPWLPQTNELLPQFANILTADVEGRVVCSGLDHPPDYSVAGRPWFGRAASATTSVVGGYEVGVITGVPLVAIARPMRDEAGRLIGVVAGGVPVARFEPLFENLGLPPDAVVTVADGEWVVLARSREADRWVGQLLPGDTATERVVGPGSGIFQNVGLDGIERIFGYAELRNADWRVYAGLPKAWIYAPVRASILYRVLAGAGALLVASLMAVSMYRRIVRSLRALVAATRAAATDEGVRVPEDGPAEVREVSEQFNRTLDARDRAEDDLLRARERYRAILENAVFGIFLCSSEDRFLEVNPALVQMLGFESVTALRATRVSDVFVDPAQFRDLFSRHHAGRRLRDIEVEWRRCDGVPITVRLSGTGVASDDGGVVIELIAEDITDRRALEEQILQTRKMEAIGRLAGGVAHDFNNLLTVVRGHGQFLLSELHEDDTKTVHAREIIEASARGARLTRQLLAFGRRQVVQPTVIDLNAVLRNLESMLRRLIGEHIILDARIPVEPLSVLADPGQVEQVVMNLVVNARDAMPDGGRLELETAVRHVDERSAGARADARPGAYAVLVVRDTGTGIAPEIAARVFEPFFTTKAQGEGTGLGLSTVYGIVTQGGGWVDLASEPGHGTTFTVLLPLVEVAPHGEREDGAPAIDAAGPATVLLVEDEPAVRRVVGHTLRRRGYRVLEAGNGVEALALAEQTGDRIDLLLTDEMMPLMRGTQLAERFVPERPGVRVLFMSGYTDRPPTGERFLGVRAAFLAKPFSQEQLLAAVRDLLAGAEAVRGNGDGGPGG